MTIHLRFLWLLLIASGLQAAQPERPNIVLVIGDDHGWPYYSFMESPQTFATNAGAMSAQELSPTPNLQALAAAGVTFTRGYSTASVCLPALRTLLSASGLHTNQWNEQHDRLTALTGSRPYRWGTESRFFRTLPRELGRHGYASWEGGKHWAGSFEDGGFTHGLALVAQPLFNRDPELGGQLFGREDWSTATCGSTGGLAQPCPALDPLRDFLDENGTAPFFVWFAPLLPHQPYDAPTEYKQPYWDLGLSAVAAGHFANIRWFDELLGELIGELDRRGLRENTLIIYVSDNGWGVDLQNFPGNGKGKGTPYDLGTRTPIIFAGLPGIIPAVYDDLVSISDIAPTILSYVEGAKSPAENVGLDLRARIEGGPPIARERLINHYDGDQIVDMPWKYIRWPDGSEELYDINVDPLEFTDLAAANPDVVTQMRDLADTDLATFANLPTQPEIFGRLVDSAGEPISGREFTYGRGPSRIQVMSDRNGMFLIGPTALGDQRLRARGDRSVTWAGSRLTTAPAGMSGLVFELNGTRKARDLDVDVGGRIVGRIVDALSGAPVPGARVRLRGSSIRSALQSHTDDRGNYRFEALPAGEFRLTVKARGYRVPGRRGIALVSTDELLTVNLAAQRR